MSRRILAGIVMALAAGATQPRPHGQSAQGHAADPPHACRFAPAVNVASLGPPRVMTGIGSSEMKISTRVPQAQRFFNQGLNLLHGFWDTEAYRAFKEAARLDPNAAMAWWGVFTALGQNAQEMSAERREALDRALALADSASEHERFYIRAASYLVDPQKGRPAYIAEMEALIDRYPDDVEAQLLLANSLSTSVASYAPDGRPREGKLYGQAILRNLLRSHPKHAAVHHYWIHAVENGPRPESALESAALLPRLVPGIGHMLHMPGHIYYRIGEHEKARRAFLDALAFDEAYMARERMHPINTWNYIHNLDYLVANAAESGRFAEALKYATILQELPVEAERLRAQGIGYLIYGGRTAVARLYMRYARWQDAEAAIRATIVAGGVGDSLATGYYEGLAEFIAGMRAVAEQAPDRAMQHADALDARWTTLSQAKVQMGGDWYFRHALRVLDVHRTELRGAIASAAGDHAAAIATLNRAAQQERDLGYWEPPHYTRPVAETLGAAYARAGDWEGATRAFQDALKLRPRSGHPLIAKARVAQIAARRADATAAYRELLDRWRHADASLPEIVEAKAYVRTQGAK